MTAQAECPQTAGEASRVGPGFSPGRERGERPRRQPWERVLEGKAREAGERVFRKGLPGAPALPRISAADLGISLPLAHPAAASTAGANGRLTRAGSDGTMTAPETYI